MGESAMRRQQLLFLGRFIELCGFECRTVRHGISQSSIMEGVGLLPCVRSSFDPMAYASYVLAGSMECVACGSCQNCTQRQQCNKEVFHKFVQIVICFSFDGHVSPSIPGYTTRWVFALPWGIILPSATARSASLSPIPAPASILNITSTFSKSSAGS